MNKIQIRPLVVMAVALALTALPTMAGVSDGSSIQLTDIPGNQLGPSIDGTIVVYQDEIGVGDDDVYYVDVTNPGVLVLVAGGPGDQRLPDISGDRIVYAGFLAPNMTGIFAYDINTGSQAQISVSTLGSQTQPSIDGNTVAYVSLNGPGVDIGVVDLSTGISSSRLITTTNELEWLPVVGGHYVVYERSPFQGGAPDVVLYDLQTDIEVNLGPGAYPHTDGISVVFARPNNLGSTDIVVYDPTSSTSQLIAESASQTGPHIDGDILVYDIATATFELKVVIYDLASGERKVISGVGTGILNDVSGRRVAYSEGNTPNGFDIYSYEFTDDIGSVEDILVFFDNSVADGTLVGVGKGNSAAGRRGALRNMIAASGDLVNEGQVLEACQQLLDAYERVDGIEPPPDFADGQSAPELAVRIQALRATLGCP
jgi:beta propeller repeat protein